MKKIDKCMKIVNDDKKLFFQAARVTYFPLAVKSAYGAIVVDADGNEYIDLLASAASINVGHSHPKVVEAIIKQVKEFINYTSGYVYHEPMVELAKKLIEITPGNYKKRVCYGLSGSDANDTMIKLVRGYTNRNNIISFSKSYHGATLGAMSLTAISPSMHKKSVSLVPCIHHMPYPDCYRCSFGQEENSCNLECLKQMEIAFENYLPPNDVAAVVIEPIEGDAGIIVPPQKYMDKLYDMCKKNGILFVSEEVQQGFGRTGKWFGIENFGIEPDMILMGKAISSGLPLSAIVAREEIMNKANPPGWNFTTAANPVSCKAVLATIKVLEDEELLKHTLEISQYTKGRFNQMKKKYEIIGDVRGLGLSIGVDLVTNRDTKERAMKAAAKICYRSWEKGVILTFFSSNVLRIQPPLIITKEQMDKAINIIEESINEYLAGDISDEVLQITKGW